MSISLQVRNREPAASFYAHSSILAAFCNESVAALWNNSARFDQGAERSRRAMTLEPQSASGRPLFSGMASSAGVNSTTLGVLRSATAVVCRLHTVDAHHADPRDGIHQAASHFFTDDLALKKKAPSGG
jgi:hypothetical protein